MRVKREVDTIPKTIHQIWFQGWHKLPEHFKKNVISVRNTNPDFEMKYWDYKGLKHACRTYSNECASAFDKFQLLHQKIDLGRYVVLYLYGGVSIDVDVEALRPLDETPLFNTSSCIVGELTLSPLELRFASFGDNNGHVGYMNNATIMCVPRHPALKALIDHAMATCDNTNIKQLPNELQISLTTGPFAFNRVLQGYDDVTIINGQYLEPCTANPGCTPPKNAILNHKHAQTWIDPNVRYGISQYYMVRNVYANTPKWVFMCVWTLIVCIMLVFVCLIVSL